MRKLGVGSAKPTEGGFLPASDDGEEVWFRREWRLITLVAVMIVAFVIRFIFAYGVSAGSDFALSGGAGAANHAHIIESILNGSFAFTDPALNYPYGSANVYPLFMDVILAGIAKIVSVFGISAGTAAAGTLAFSTPIFAALTCWPVYLIGRKMFGDEKIGLLSALLYAFFALLIRTSVFSNGTEYAFVGFLFAFMIYFLLKSLEVCDETQPGGFRAMIRDRAVLKNILIAGILFTMIVLSWNQFRIILLMLVFFMAAQAVVDRLRSKAITPAVGIYSAVIMIGILISLPYYIIAGLWDLVFSGPFIIAVMSVALTVLFSKTAGRSWVLMIPVILIIAAAVLAAIYFVSGDLFSAVINGNSIYTNGLMAGLASTSAKTSISAMAAFFGWVTVWLPLVMFLYMLYKYRRNADSRKYTFTMWWILLMFCVGWYSTSYAAISGAGFAVASASLILMAMRRADLKSYFADMRGNGAKHALKKTLKPIPLATTLALIVLIAAPNLVYAVDASTPTNSENGGYFGGLGYTIMTDDINSMNKMWSETSSIHKDGALVTWLGYSIDAVSRGGFDSVTDSFGGGASAMSAVLLANSGSAATAAMMIRLMLSKDLSDYRTAITAAGLDYNKIKGYIDEPSTAVREVKDNIDIYGGVSHNVTEENAVYLVLTHYITSTISGPKVSDLYDSVRRISGGSINYVSVNISMLPLYYNDGSYFSTVAFLGSYSTDAYGAATKFFSYNTYSGYATYTNEMYDTFFWKALIGMSPSEAGYSSSTEFLNALALSDGKVKTDPGYGLADYKIAYWHVYYNPDSSATTSSSGWTDMDAYEAIALQSSQGGMINYVNGVVMMEYDSSSTDEVSGTVSYVSQSGTAGAEGIQVSVFVDIGRPEYAKRSTAFTDAAGRYSVSVPVSGDYYVVFSSGTDTLATGSVIETRGKAAMTGNANLLIPATSLSGSVYVSSDPYKPYTENSYVVISGKASGKTYEANVAGGDFSFSNIIPDVYTLTVFSPSGTTINSGSVTVNAGSSIGYRISATSGTITVTVTTDVGANAPDGTVITAQDRSTGSIYTGSVKDGKAQIAVVPSTYNIYASGSKISVSNPSATVSNNSTSSASLTVFDARSIAVSGAPSGGLVTIMSYGFMTSSSSSYTFAVPASGGSANDRYTAYAVSGGSVYYGVTAGSSISMASSTGYKVSGTVLDSSDKPLSGTVSFIMGNGATFIFSSDKDGKFDVTLPAGTYTMYVYSTSSALIKTVTVSGDQDMGKVNTSKARDLTLNLTYRTNMSSASTRGIAFVDINMSMTIDSTEYNIMMKTDPTGKAAFTVPQGYAATMTSPGFDTARFHMDAQSREYSSGTGSTSYSWTLAASRDADATMYVKTVSVSNSVPVDITLYSSSTTKYSGTNLTDVIPGQYTAVIKGSTGYYFNGTIYIYPGQTGALNIPASNVVRVALNASSSDRITVTPTDEEKGSYYADPDDPLVYYLQRGKSFYFTASSGEQIAYASIANASAPATLNLLNKADKAVIDGYVGVTANGTLTVTYGSVSIPFAITDGTFGITVPAGTAMQFSASVSKTIGSTAYTYTGSTSVTAGEAVDGATIRFPVTTSSSQNTLDLSGSGFSFANGTGQFTLSIKNTGSYSATYTITAGTAWVLDRGYTLTVNAGQTGTITIRGTYDQNKVGAGNENLSVTVKSINGTAVGTYVLDGSAFDSPGATSTDTYVDISGTDGAFSDAVSGHEYMYAVTLTNKDSHLKTVSVTASISGGSGNWSLVYADKNGGMIFPAAGTNSFSINGFGSSVIYIKLMHRDGSDTNVPTVSVTVTTPQGQTLNSNTGEVHIGGSGRTATFSMSAQLAEMEAQGMKATGNNIYDSRSPMPISTAVLAVLVILAFMAMIWLGMKKGVFVRRK